MADELAQALYLKDADAEHAGLYTNDGKRLPDNHKIDAVTFSGGVADCIYHPEGKETFQYGDIGVLLGRAILDHPAFQEYTLVYRSRDDQSDRGRCGNPYHQC